MSPTALDWEVLNATADDWESVEQIRRLLAAGLDSPVPVAVVTDAVRRLAERRLLVARLPDAEGLLPGAPREDEMDEAWFQMTPEGRAAWARGGPDHA